MKSKLISCFAVTLLITATAIRANNLIIWPSDLCDAKAHKDCSITLRSVGVKPKI
ncbi:MAG: hypothetical protein R6V06_01325 [Kiritimatiellia bacterium]